MPNQNEKRTLFQSEMVKVFAKYQTKTAKITLWGRTYPYTPYKEAPPDCHFTFRVSVPFPKFAVCISE